MVSINCIATHVAAKLIHTQGWCTWNAYHRNFNASLFYTAISSMQANGMQAAGYEYINVYATPPLL